MDSSDFGQRIVRLALTACIAFFASCGTVSISGPETGPVPPLDGGDSGSVTEPIPASVMNSVDLSCPGFPNTLALAAGSATPGALLPEPVIIAGDEAQFTASTSNLNGGFGKVSQIEILVSAQDTFAILTFRAGAVTDGQLRFGQYFTDAFSTTSSGITARPTMSLFDGERRCSSKSGDFLEITDLEVNMLTEIPGRVKRFRAAFRLDCIQGCVSFVE